MTFNYLQVIGLILISATCIGAILTATIHAYFEEKTRYVANLSASVGKALIEYGQEQSRKKQGV